jgi:hypothetical protein
MKKEVVAHGDSEQTRTVQIGCGHGSGRKSTANKSRGQTPHLNDDLKAGEGNAYDFASNADLADLEKIHPRWTFEAKLESWGITDIEPAQK